MKAWVKTILNVYRYLERVSNAIDKIVISRATNSYYISLGNLSFNGVMSVSDDILNLTERKVKLINLKVITENAFKKTNSELAKLLILNFVEKRTCYESAKILNISIRTYFRKLNIALKSFENALSRMGYDDKFFDRMLAGEKWILEVKEKMQGKDDIFEINSKFAKKICMDLKSNTTYKSFSPQIHSSPTL